MMRDSLRKMEVDSLVAKRIERSSRLADEEKARMARVQFKVQEYQRKKIERAKARAARRGKEYDGPEFEDLSPMQLQATVSLLLRIKHMPMIMPMTMVMLMTTTMECPTPWLWRLIA
jgi:hypothetical protein